MYTEACLEVNHRLQQVAGERKVCDVTVDSISIVSAYRSAFTGEFGNHDSDAPITLLRVQHGRMATA